MGAYKIEDLEEKGPKYAMALLLNCLKEGQPFVTYGSIRDELQYQLKIEHIFSVHIGHVAGALMNAIIEIYPNAPLINVLITNPEGIPGKGAGEYLADRYNDNSCKHWKTVSRTRKLALVERERRKILSYPHWEKISTKLFGDRTKTKLKKKAGTENDGLPKDGRRYGGEAESKEHKALKAWVAKNPQKIGLSKSFGKGVTEHYLLSGDSVDVFFSNGIEFVTVEVKSCRSNDVDFQRGIYQCVKYRNVKEAEYLPSRIKVRAILITERKLNNELMARARMLGVRWKTVTVDK
jgi:hypothetical protein